MMLLLKISGTVIILAVSYIFGQLKVSSLKNRKENLHRICIGLEGLKKSVGFGGWELAVLYKKHFGDCGFLEFKDSTHLLLEKDFTAEDIALINEFFKGAGALDLMRECERIGLYTDLIKKQLNEAEEKLLSDGKLWKTISLCTGLGIGILLL